MTDTEERYSVPDTLAWQGNAYVRTGTVLRSNLGNPLMTVVGIAAVVSSKKRPRIDD